MSQPEYFKLACDLTRSYKEVVLAMPAPTMCHHPALQINDDGMCCDCGAQVGPCYQCSIRDGGKARQQIVFCPLHAQAGQTKREHTAMREVLEDLCDGASWALAIDQRQADKVDRARAILKEIEG